MKVVFMGTPSFASAVLNALLQSGHSVVSVYAKTASDVACLATESGLTLKTPHSLKGYNMDDDADVAVVAAYGLIIPGSMLERFRHGFINIHPSILPKWRGAAPIERAIMAGDQVTGVSIMQLGIGLDDGDVLCSEEVDIMPDDDGGTLSSRLAEVGSAMLLSVLGQLEAGCMLHRAVQDEALVTYAHKISAADEIINWMDDGRHIFNKIRALSPDKCAHFFIGEHRIRLIKATFQDVATGLDPGTIIDEKMNIAVKGGILTPIVVQRAGGKRLPVPDFLRGFLVSSGMRLL